MYLDKLIFLTTHEILLLLSVNVNKHTYSMHLMGSSLQHYWSGLYPLDDLFVFACRFSIGATV